MKDQIDVPLVIDANGKVLLTVENSKKYMQQMAQPQARKASKRHVPPAEENETGEENDSMEDQPQSRLIPATTSQRRSSRRALSPTFSERESGSRNTSAQPQPNVEREHRPGHPTFFENANDDAPAFVSRPPRAVTQVAPQPQSTRPALPEDTRYHGSPASETQSQSRLIPATTSQ